jgi:hypothetical protein
LSWIGTCGTQPQGKAVAALTPKRSTSSRTPSMPRFGSTPTAPKKRSGWSFSAFCATSLRGETPIIAFSTPKRSISWSV